MESKLNNKSRNKDDNKVSKSKKTYAKEDVEKKVRNKAVRRNQCIIAALTVLLGIAGYINFTGNVVDLSEEEAFAQTKVDDVEISLDETNEQITIADLAYEDVENINDVENYENNADIELNSNEDSIGEAVLTSTNSMTHNFANMKLNREQTRSKSKEYYLEIINGDDMDGATVQSATDAYMKLTNNMEKEAAAETILSAKGFSGVIVSVGEDSVDVVLAAKELSDTDRAKIEDIVVRKTGCRVEQINITTVSE